MVLIRHRQKKVRSDDKLLSGLPLLVDGSEPYALYVEGDDLYDAMLKSISAAKNSIRFESYIFADDEVGRLFAEAMVDRVRQGVNVSLHLDAAGSLFRSSSSLEKYLDQNGVRLRWFHRWSWHSPLRYNRRNHRKLLVIDEDEVYLGGFNIHRENSRKLVGDARWRDTHLKLTGQCARDAVVLFDQFWKGQRRWIANNRPAVYSLIPNHTLKWRKVLRNLYTHGIRNAETSVYLTTPYFVPDHRLQRDLICVARKGVDVRLLLPRKTDVWITQWMAWAAYSELLAAGVRIYEYLPRVLHAKTVVAEGCWSMLGTANLDYRSFFVNYELNVVSRDTSLCEQLQRQFMLDLDQAEEVTLQKWRRRSLSRVAAGLVGWLARRWFYKWF